MVVVTIRLRAALLAAASGFSIQEMRGSFDKRSTRLKFAIIVVDIAQVALLEVWTLLDKRTVLVVDDDVIMLDMLHTWFIRQGCQCEIAEHAGKALQLLRERHFDIMITDVKMPGMKGFELTELAKSLRPETLVIVMTGFAEDFSYDAAIEAGASDFIKKPFTLQELMVRIRQAMVTEELRVQSLVDDMTGLYNRRGFMTLAEHQLRIANRTGKGLFLLFADLDGLKAINDTHGHQEGDLVLIEMATMLRENYRESDIVARVGGDEFVVFPVGTGDDCLETIITRLEDNLRRHGMKGPKNYKRSISYGIAFYDPESPCSIEELMSRADRLMYQQKRQKQN
ncbi:MAG: diguanylate cyclase domain-containing protein [Chloroflexota bacterium]